MCKDFQAKKATANTDSMGKLFSLRQPTPPAGGTQPAYIAVPLLAMADSRELSAQLLKS